MYDYYDDYDDDDFVLFHDDDDDYRYEEEALKQAEEAEDDYYDEYESDTFRAYRGTYAQEVGGYSDQEIDELFDGDPDMYWNID